MELYLTEVLKCVSSPPSPLKEPDGMEEYKIVFENIYFILNFEFQII